MKTQQLTRITQPDNTLALTIRITAMLVATLAIFHQHYHTSKKFYKTNQTIDGYFHD